MLVIPQRIYKDKTSFMCADKKRTIGVLRLVSLLKCPTTAIIRH